MDLKNENQTGTRTQLDALFTLAQHHLDLGQAEFAHIDDSYNLALLLSNAGRLMRMQALYRCSHDKRGFQPTEKAYYDKALNLYRAGLGVLGNRKSGPQVWDVIMWEMSTTLYTMATLYQDYPPALVDKNKEDAERELIELLTKALQSCDLTTTDFRQCMYQFRAAMLHYRLGSLYQHIYRNKPIEDSRKKNVLHLVNLHYDKSAALMQVLEHPLEFLRLQMERVALQEFIAENTISPYGKLKSLEGALDFLISCQPVLDSIIDRTKAKEKVEDDKSELNAGRDHVKPDENINEEENLLLLFESRLQFVLKSIVKLCLSTSNQKISNLSSKYKEMYSVVLKQNKTYPLATQLRSAVLAIVKLR